MFPILLSVLLVLWLPFEVIAIKPSMYKGTIHTTVYGMTCQHWKSDSPHAHNYNNLPENYCRDPDGTGGIWCYTTNPNVRWDLCDPRELYEVRPYKSILSNTTGSVCKKAVCCNLTWRSFIRVYKKCDPRMFVKLLIYYSPAYIGCFKDTNDRDLPKNVKDVKSVNECKEECKDQGYLYAGVQYGHECFCGNQYGRYGKTDNCDMKCSNRVDICGGFWANSIYKTDLQTKPTAEFVERYVVAPYFTFILDINVGSKEDCAAQCRKKSGCDGFFYSGGNRCRLGKLNSPDAIKTLTFI